MASRISYTDYEAAFNEGYEEAKESYVAELKRLRAENEKFRAAIQNVYAAVAKITTEAIKTANEMATDTRAKAETIENS